MKTADWIDTLAHGAGPAPRGEVARRLTLAALFGIAAGVAVVFTVLGGITFGVQPLRSLLTKLAFTGALALAAAYLTARYSRPGSSTIGAIGLVIAIIAAMLLVGLLSVRDMTAGNRFAEMLGHSWWICPIAVLSLALPGLGAALWAVRGLAPTRPLATGLAVGLLAGAGGAFAYSFGCIERAPSFVAVWYTLGVLLTGAVGAILGSRVLRW